MLRHWLSACLFWCFGCAAAVAQTGLSPMLGVASSFGQSWYPDLLSSAEAIPVRTFRDEMYWERIEDLGQYQFSQFMTTYPHMIGAKGNEVSLLLSGGHPAYDGGHTPHSPEAVAAFGKMAAAVVARFPAITSVEIGNEFNGQDFVTGPVRATSSMDRAARYMSLLKSSHAQVKSQNAATRVIGGAVLGIPVGYLSHIFALGGADYMDALAIHPYTTSVEQFTRQIAVLRRINAASTLPIEVTEFGDPDPVTAPGHLLKAYCQFALAGVTRLIWYPLSPRGDGMTPLFDQKGNKTSVGQTYGFVQSQLAGVPFADAAPDPFTYACTFGDTKLVIWGEDRALTLSGDAQAFDATGTALDPKGLRLSMDTPLLIVANSGIALGSNVVLAPQTILADSAHQYAYPKAGQVWPESDPFQRFTRKNGIETPLETSPGQDGPGTLWTPSLRDPFDGYIRLTAEFLRPDGTATAPVAVVHRYIAGTAANVDVSAHWSVRPDQGDGVRVTVLLNGQVLADQVGVRDFIYHNPRLVLASGDQLEFAVGPGGTADGDLTDYRITLRQAE